MKRKTPHPVEMERTQDTGTDKYISCGIDVFDIINYTTTTGKRKSITQQSYTTKGK